MVTLNRYRSFLRAFVIGIIASILVSTLVFAQGGGIRVHVYDVDVSGFPQILARVVPMDTDGKVITGLTSDAFSIYEDNTSLPVESVEEEYVGVQVAFVFDASGSFALPATVGEGTRKDDAIVAMYELFRKGAGWLQTDLQKDQMMLMAPKGHQDSQILQSWTNLYNTIYNQAFSVELVRGETPLFKMVSESLKRMRDLPDYQRRAKFLVVLSDGVDHMSPQEGTDVILRANNLGVNILSIKIGPPEAGEAKNLQRIAEETNGLYAAYTGADSLAPLYALIKSQAYQYKLTYVSQAAESGAHALEVEVASNGTKARSNSVSYSINIEPISVKILAPEANSDTAPGAELLDGKSFERVANRWDEDLTTLEPTKIPIRVLIDFPDAHAREIQSVMYEVDGRIIATLPTSQMFYLDFSQLKPGVQQLTLRVIVKDRLGVESVSEPAVITVNTIVPPRPEESTISGSIPGGSGHTVQLLVNGAEAGISIQADAEGNFQFSHLKAGTYYVRDSDRIVDKGRTIGPVEVDGENTANITFAKVSIADILREIPQWYWFLFVLALLAVGLALYAIIKKPPVVQEAMTTIVGAVRDATEVFRPRRSKRTASAFLVPVVDDAGRLGEPKALNAQTMYIGRDPARAQIVFTDRSVSRLHARIVEESDNVFVLHDEGSSSGTYVNGDPVTASRPHHLQPGDRIEFGRVQVIFQTHSSGSDDLTEVFLSQA